MGGGGVVQILKLFSGCPHAPVYLLLKEQSHLHHLVNSLFLHSHLKRVHYIHREKEKAERKIQ